MEWISVKDRLPKNCTCVLAYYREGARTLYYHDNGRFSISSTSVHGRYVKKTVSHWIPLPEPPEDK